MGPVAVLDRFRQIAPKVLVAVDGQVWGGVTHDRRPVLREVLAGLPSVQHLVLLADVDTTARGADFAAPGRQGHDFADWVARPGDPGATGSRPGCPSTTRCGWCIPAAPPACPSPSCTATAASCWRCSRAARCTTTSQPTVDTGERFHWFSSTGWIMWNAQVGALLGGTTICLYDGNPAGRPAAPDWGTLWRFAGAAGVTWFGAGAAYFASCMKAHVEPMREADLSRLRAIGCTGSPLADEGYQWIWDHCPKVDGQDIWLDPISGGTDFAGAFVGGNRTLPVVKGEMQCRCLGAAVEAWSEDGRPLIDEVGELVCTKPMPSMPLYFWGDEGNQRYLESYFDMFPGVWRHGDWIRITPDAAAR